jgi:hypothetical protein
MRTSACLKIIGLETSKHWKLCFRTSTFPLRKIEIGIVIKSRNDEKRFDPLFSIEL